MPTQALVSAKQQLEYWQNEYAKARESEDAVRVQRCEEFLRQCEDMIDALEYAAARLSPRPRH